MDPEIVGADGTASSAGYRAIRDVLVASGIWLAMARKDTIFAPAWTPERFAREFDTTPLLGLPVGEPPVVLTPLRSHNWRGWAPMAHPMHPQLARVGRLLIFPLWAM